MRPVRAPGPTGCVRAIRSGSAITQDRGQTLQRGRGAPRMWLNEGCDVRARCHPLPPALRTWGRAGFRPSGDPEVHLALRTQVLTEGALGM